MRRTAAVLSIAVLAVVMTALSMERPAGPQGQTEQTVKTETFKGKVVSTRQKGSMAKPYIAVGVAGEDGKEVIFNLRKNTELTDVDGVRA